MEPGQELPSPSAELVALRVFAEAHWRMLKPKDRLRFQSLLVEALSDMDSEPIRIRGEPDHAALKVARESAKVWVGRVLRDLVRMGI